MVDQIKTFDKNVLAITVIDSFTENDENICQKWMQEKLDQGFDQVNILVKIDEMKISGSSTKAFFEDSLYILRNYKKMGHIAVVAHSKILKALIPIDNLFFQRASKGRHERYFDVSQLDEAFEFVNPN
ncbi:SpoIIAA family protein [Algoriphagus chordae]|uniref:SpoIIAA-like protein n=1 Tax=Algoriphagus chordae TaxID=237019 RepID=A0A2W7QVR3_9BACT|nr:STAS/SEC14 domain-containing protein [Algoriphagus chordae]PZX52071.1 SpoIIAA-like protein [Algoriphagus chordae]